MRRRLYWLLAASFVVKLLYVFLWTDYSQYLFSDFRGYWERALERLDGRDTEYTQWALWPPLAHIALSWVFRCIDLLGLSTLRLELVLGINVLLSTINVACAYCITLRLTQSSRIAFVAAALLAVFFPLIYFNAFVMSEHPASTALLLALWLLVRYPAHRGALFCAGALLAFATGLRPAFGLFAVPCGFYALFANPFSRFSIVSAAIFSGGFILLLAGVVAEVGRISGGEIRGLAANGGLSFYFAQCETHEVTARAPPYSFYVIPPATVEHPENGRLISPQPFHKQNFFSELGWRCIRAQPNWAWHNAKKLGQLFFGPLLPDVPTARGYSTLLPVFRWLSLGLFLAVPLGVLFIRRSRHRGAAALLGGIILAALFTQYAFNAEHRYLYPLIPMLAALAAWNVASVYRQWRDVRAQVVGYCVVLAGVGVAIAAHGAIGRHSSPTLIEAEWRLLSPKSETPISGRFTVDTLRFSQGQTFHHPRHGNLDLPKPATHVEIHFETCLQVDSPGEFDFVVASDDGFELEINGVTVASHPAPRSYDATRGSMALEQGRHRYSLRYVQITGPLGLAAVWRRSMAEGQWMPAVGLREVGAGDGTLHFLPPGECGGVRR